MRSGGIAGQSALVVGATGLVGSAVTRRLLDGGWAVTATARSESVAERAADAFFGATVEILPTLLDGAAFDSILASSRPDVVISCAGLLPARGMDGPRQLVDVNVTATAVLLDACRRSRTQRVLTFGSGFEYLATSAPIDELAEIGPTSWYGAAKVAASAFAIFMRASADLDICVLRPFSVYGPRERVGRFVPDVVTAALDGMPIEMSSGLQRRDYLYVDDLADAVARAAAVQDALPASLNLAGPEVHDLLDLARMVIELTGTSSPLRPGARPANPGDRDVFLGDTGRARLLLGWEPQVDLRGGLRRTIDWYAGHRAVWDATGPGRSQVSGPTRPRTEAHPRRRSSSRR